MKNSSGCTPLLRMWSAIHVWVLSTLGLLATTLICGCVTMATSPNALPPRSGLSEAMLLRDAQSARASSFDQTGGNFDLVVVQPQERRVLADIEGSGCVKHIYWTYIIGEEETRRKLFRDMIVRMYWDGEATPSVECPIGDLFGISNCRVRPVKSLALVANPGANNNPVSHGLNCYFPMPFSRDARIEITNDSDVPLGIWYHIDHERYDKAPPWLAKAGRFHAQFRRSNPTTKVDLKGVNKTGDDNYVILDAEGDGALAGYMLSVDNISGGWWG
ncbi:MAG TPA: DUF2961 domain-containing protein, partial [Candidatus Hydrogenedentes bacterium]|nr:DUF2961 domain-containing protein [Candidatus Hydrogenedentota bacterium]